MYTVEWLYISVAADNCSALMNFILEGKLCFTETISTIMNFILEGKMTLNGYVHLFYWNQTVMQNYSNR